MVGGSFVVHRECAALWKSFHPRKCCGKAKHSPVRGFTSIPPFFYAQVVSLVVSSPFFPFYLPFLSFRVLAIPADEIRMFHRSLGLGRKDLIFHFSFPRPPFFSFFFPFLALVRVTAFRWVLSPRNKNGDSTGRCREDGNWVRPALNEITRALGRSWKVDFRPITPCTLSRDSFSFGHLASFITDPTTFPLSLVRTFFFLFPSFCSLSSQSRGDPASRNENQ